MKKIILFGIVLLLLSSFASAIVTNEYLALYYALEETTQPYGENVSGKDIVTGAEPSRELGKNNFGQYFNDAAEELVTPNDIVNWTLNASFSVSIWANLSSGTAADHVAWSFMATEDVGFIYLNYNGGNDRWQMSLKGDVGGPVKTCNIGAGGNWDDDVFRSFIFVYNGSDPSQSSLYINATRYACDLTFATGNYIIGRGTENHGHLGASKETSTDVWKGVLDEWAVWNKSLNQNDVDDLYDLGAGRFYPFTAPPPGAASNTINLSSPLPINGSQFNVLDVNFNLSANASNQFNCSLYLDNNLNQTRNEISAGQNIGVDFNVTFGADGEFTYVVGCFDGLNDTNTTESTFFIDLTLPEVVTDFFNNSFFFRRNLTAQFNFSDNLLLHSINISIDDLLIFNQTNIAQTTFQFNLSYNVSNFTLGRHTMSATFTDGHTDEELSDNYDWSNGLFNDYLRYNFPDGGMIETELKNKSIFDDWTTERKIDRYTQTFIPANPSSTQTFIEESDLPIYIVNRPGYYKGTWVIVGNHWKDYVLKNEQDSKVSIKRINDYKVEVTISEIKNTEKLEFESIGDLNVVTETWDFYVVNMTSEFDPFALTNFSFTINLTMDFGLLEFNISDLVSNVTLEFDDTNFTATEIVFNNTTGIFRKTFSVAESTFEGNIFHKWYFDLGNYTPELLESTSDNQTIVEIEIKQCGTSANHTILNITYFDEVDDQIINANNAYQLKIFDGTYFYNQTSSFPRDNTSQLCTNLRPSLLTYNWDMWGAFTLSETAYITRIVDIDEAVPIIISNNPQTELSLFLIQTANSSTVTYNWFTSNFELITGTMRINQCNPDGSQDLIESVPVIAGVATANIELLTQPYSYDIVVGGRVFTDTNDFSRCHVESATELTFFVDISGIDVGELIGLNAIPCTITKATNTSINMTWTPNSQQSGYVQGCVIANRRALTGNIEVLNNCSVEADGYSRTVEIPIVEGNTYIVSGELKQGDRTVICAGQVSFNPSDEAGGLFSFTGLIAAFFLVLSLILMYSGDGEGQLTGAGIGIVIAWIIGILNWGWIVTSSIITFLIIIALVGRNSRVSTVP